MKRVRVIKPLRINDYILEVGDEFDVDHVDQSDLPEATFFHPANVEGMPKGVYWLFTERTFEVVA